MSQRFAVLVLATPIAVAILHPPAHAAQRVLYNTVNAGSQEFIYPASFQAYVDSSWDHGFRKLRVSGVWWLRCLQCAPDIIDINTNPAPGVYDFSTYFDRLDYAIRTKGMQVQLNFSLAGRLATDPLNPGAQRALPTFLNASDIMLYRNLSGRDVMFLAGPEAGNLTRAPRFEKPSVRAAILDFVTAVVTQFRARYSDMVTAYCFTFGQFGESEYPLPEYPYFCDTSPEAAQTFRAWLMLRYGSPQAVSTAWNHQPPFQSFGEIEILDGQPPPALGEAPQAYLDFMAYRENALGSFNRQIRDRIHAAGGKAMLQLGSVWDVLSTTRGTVGFGREIAGFDRVVVDDAPEYDHLYSMDYTRTNTPGVPFGNELDAPCRFGCTTTASQCCDASTYPTDNDIPAGMVGVDAQVNQSYERGASWVDFANWDNFYQTAFGLFSSSLENAVSLSSGLVSAPVAADTQHVSMRALYVKHHDSAYIDSLVAAHAALGGNNQPIAVVLHDDLAPAIALAAPPPARGPAIELGPPRPNPIHGEGTITVVLPARGQATVRLFDLAGRLVATLADGTLEAGAQGLRLDARRLEPGVYLCRLQAAGQIRTRRIVIVR